MFKYDVSVIVAVYNNATYLPKCIESVLKQTYKFEKIQLILINDGSTDDSLKICRKYEKEYSNILVIDQENKGVSAARNAGLKAAEGKYIMILDSDDRISKRTVDHLVNFFNKHYEEIDLVTYPMLCITKKRRYYNYRFYLYKNGEGIYDIDKHPYLMQSGINIIFKNQKEIVPQYNIKMIFSEDEEFNTNIIMKKGKIGFCSKAQYLYNRENENSATKIVQNPLFCFESIMNYYEGLVKRYRDENGNLPKYIQALVLNNISWRVKSNELYPYYMENEEFEKAKNRIIDLLKNIDVEIINNMPILNIYHKLYVLKLKGSKLDFNFLPNNKYEISCENNSVLVAKKASLLLSEFKIINEKLKITGCIRTPIYEIIDKSPKLYMVYTDTNGEKREKLIEDIFISNKSFNNKNLKVSNFYGFKTEIPIKDVKKFKFIIKLDNHKIDTSIYFGYFCKINPSLKQNKIKSKDKIIKYLPSANKKQYQFYIMPKNLSRAIRYHLEEIRSCKSLKVLFYRLFSNSNKKIWLYNDRKTLIDNAYYQFKHDSNKNDGIDRYYIYDGDKNDLLDKFNESERCKLVKHSSFKHKILFLRAKKILTSFSSTFEYNPFGKSLLYYKDITNYELVYLQHGVLHAELIKQYSKELNEIDKIVVSSNFEKDSYINKYKYSEKDIILSGMPRLQDSKLNNIDVKNKIIFVPSWRNYLIGEFYEGKRELKLSAFKKSSYYKQITDFMNSDRLKEILEKNNMTLDIKMHPIFDCYADLFKPTNKCVRVVSSVNINEYKILITDFSSFQFDFVRLQRPIIYFVPDIKEFKAGLHTYRKLDLPYEEAFGKLTVSSKELLDNLEKIINNNYTDDEVYLNRERNFFINLDNIQDNLYNELMKGE